MSNSVEEILAALESSDSISADVARGWMQKGDLRTRGAMYHYLSRASHRVAPPLSADEQRIFAFDYLIDCLLENPESDDYSHSGFEAAGEIARWVRHLENSEDGQSLIRPIIDRLTETYLAANETTRNRIETGTVEHIMESPPLRKHFASWKGHPALGKAYELCLQWGQDHER